MTVDERELSQMCHSLESQIHETTIRLADLKKTCGNLQTILRPDGDTGTAAPHDPRTDTDMTDATRLEIYNALMPHARTLLAPPTDDED